MKMNELVVAAIQSRIYSRKEETINKIEEQIRRAKDLGAEIVCLPERWNYFKGIIDEDSEEIDGLSNTSLSKIAKNLEIYIIGGAIWQKLNDKYIISSSFFNPKGERIGIQQKQHLYLFERECFERAQDLNIFETELGKIGILICFDMTFPETPRKLALKGADILFTPVMIRSDGIENWHLYLQTRALENRIPVVGVNIVGRMPEKNYGGESMIIDFKRGHISPSKLCIMKAKKDEEDIIIKKIDLEFCRKLRKIRLNERLDSDNHLI